MLPFDLVGIGNPVYDTIVTPAARTEGRVLSGCSTNGCLAAKKLGLKKVGLIGNIGPDYVEKFRADMERYNISTNLDVTSGETGGFHLIYDERGNRTLDVLGVAEKITSKSLPDEFLDTRFFLIGPILGEVDLELLEFIRSSSSATIFLDPQGLVRVIGEDRRIIHKCDHEVFRKIARLSDFVKPNEQESETITGERDPIAALRQISEFGPKVSIVTLAERGSIILGDDTLYRVPPFPTDAIDPTGAGDVYAGSFITEFEGTGDVAKSALFASAAASIKVEQVGPDFQMASKAVEKRRDTIRGGLVVEEKGQ